MPLSISSLLTLPKPAYRVLLALGLSGAVAAPLWAKSPEAISFSPNGNDQLYDVAYEKSGSFYAVGTYADGSDRKTLIAKFNADGSRDSSFGTEDLLLLNLIKAGECELARNIRIESLEISSDRSSAKSEILAHFVENLVLPRYRNLEARSQILADEIKAFSQQRSQESLDKARTAWRLSRQPWEESEAFLFGPVDSLGYDPALDSWPLDLSAFTQALPELAGQDELNMFEVDPALKGFHAMEYLLFGLNNDKELASFTASEYRYLIALAEHQAEISTLLLASWTEGFEGSGPFASIFKSAGTPGNEPYPTEADALQELLEGMVGIADELALSKLGEALASGDPNLVESRFSHNSLDDFLSNLKGIRLVYSGGTSSPAEKNSIAALMVEQNPELHEKILAALDQAQRDLERIPQPFVKAIADDDGRKLVASAKASLEAVFSLLDQDLRAAL